MGITTYRMGEKSLSNGLHQRYDYYTVPASIILEP